MSYTQGRINMPWKPVKTKEERLDYNSLLTTGTTIDRIETVNEPDNRIVAFSVGLTDVSNVNEGAIVVFGLEVYNDGGYYDVSRGIFTCPTNGVYLFNVNARPNDRDYECNVRHALSTKIHVHEHMSIGSSTCM